MKNKKFTARELIYLIEQHCDLDDEVLIERPPPMKTMKTMNLLPVQSVTCTPADENGFKEGNGNVVLSFYPDEDFEELNMSFTPAETQEDYEEWFDGYLERTTYYD
jgi:hypothetical protein